MKYILIILLALVVGYHLGNQPVKVYMGHGVQEDDLAIDNKDIGRVDFISTNIIH